MCGNTVGVLLRGCDRQEDLLFPYSGKRRFLDENSAFKLRLSLDDPRQQALSADEIGYKAQIGAESGKRRKAVVELDLGEKTHPPIHRLSNLRIEST